MEYTLNNENEREKTVHVLSLLSQIETNGNNTMTESNEYLR